MKIELTAQQWSEICSLLGFMLGSIMCTQLQIMADPILRLRLQKAIEKCTARTDAIITEINKRDNMDNPSA